MHPRSALLVLALSFAALPFTLSAKADTITYTVTDTASGTLGSTTFSDEAVTVTLTGDPSTVDQQNANRTTEAGTATISIAGLGTYTFTDSMSLLINHSTDLGSITDQNGYRILGTQNSAFSSYLGTTSFGPVSGTSETTDTAGGLVPNDVNTNGGILEFTTIGATSTFTADVDATAATPEPSSLALLGTGILSTAAFARRRLFAR